MQCRKGFAQCKRLDADPQGLQIPTQRGCFESCLQVEIVGHPGAVLQSLLQLVIEAVVSAQQARVAFKVECIAEERQAFFKGYMACMSASA